MTKRRKPGEAKAMVLAANALGKTPQQIAAETGLSVDHVRVTLYRDGRPTSAEFNARKNRVRDLVRASKRLIANPTRYNVEALKTVLAQFDEVAA